MRRGTFVCIYYSRICDILISSDEYANKLGLLAKEINPRPQVNTMTMS